MSASGYDGAYPKVSSWKTTEGETSNCCSWDGVGCDDRTGRVIALDVSHSYLYGQIPQKLAQLTSLTYFNVSHNNLTGSIPQRVLISYIREHFIRGKLRIV
ncbi:hypothetical protein M0R45_035694 [Rubus argutus]|uniref:Leucine-rich repeat-containing N-terminal plant-type domain-containing protein n=1 Tax=Rubus argutus TaxID=59490 RepID=A0AAW1VVE3_RUBAR